MALSSFGVLSLDEWHKRDRRCFERQEAALKMNMTMCTAQIHNDFQQAGLACAILLNRCRRPDRAVLLERSEKLKRHQLLKYSQRRNGLGCCFYVHAAARS